MNDDHDKKHRKGDEEELYKIFKQMVGGEPENIENIIGATVETIEAEKSKKRPVLMEERNDLYRVVKEIRESKPHSELSTSRLLVMCRLFDYEKQREQFRKDTRDWIDDYDRQFKAKITGYLWLKGIYNLHLLESDSKVLNEYVRYLHTMASRKDTYYTGITVLTFNEDCPQRWFTHWGEGDLNWTPPQKEDHNKSEAELSDLNWKTYESFYQASLFFAQRLTQEKKITPQLWKDIASKINPNNEELFCLGCDNFMSIFEFYDLYLAELEIELESEFHYPQNKTMIDILEYNDNPL